MHTMYTIDVLFLPRIVFQSQDPEEGSGDKRENQRVQDNDGSSCGGVQHSDVIPPTRSTRRESYN